MTKKLSKDRIPYTKRVALWLCLVLGLMQLHGQEVLVLDASSAGTSHQVSRDGTRIVDDGGTGGAYAAGGISDRYITITGECEQPYGFQLSVEQLDFRRKRNGEACPDTLFVYDGADTSASLLWFATGNSFMPHTYIIYASPSNTAHALTVRFKVCGDCGTWDPATGGGFSLLAGCKLICETLTPHLDSIYYKTREGKIYEFSSIKHLFDTVMRTVENTALGTVDTIIDTLPFEAVNLCRGDGVIFTAHCDYTNFTGWYTPTDSTSSFKWDTGVEGVTIEGNGKTSISYDEYNEVRCYNLSLVVTDERGCQSNTIPTARVRVASNPLRTIHRLDEICSDDSVLVTMSYSSNNATLVMNRVVTEEVGSKADSIRVFIPDGPQCQQGCYESQLDFTGFPNGRTITSPEDIASICINIEHSYIGDLSIAIICPSYGEAGRPSSHGKAYLKSFTQRIGAPEGTWGGEARYLGLPYGGRAVQNSNTAVDTSSARSWDNPASPCTESSYYGRGWNYCFSRNGSYTLVSGVPANSATIPNGSGLANGQLVNAGVNFTPDIVPSGYHRAGETAGLVNINTTDSSDRAGKSNYYIPADDFTSLIGCPLNGTWKIEICDSLVEDNGWVFGWSLEINNLDADVCEYEVGIDSLVWESDTSSHYHHYDDLGRYHGAVSHPFPLVKGSAYVLTPDTAGTFPFNVHIYDEFGCVWDTTTSITSYWSPHPSLGNDTTLCGNDQIVLDASDRRSEQLHYNYIWQPTGQTTPTITTDLELGENKSYAVQVTYTQGIKSCVTRDTISIRQRSNPYPSFVATPFTFEGCSPMTLEFRNQTADAASHLWDFGDGTYSLDANPTHSYSDGIYTLKYVVTSSDGCKDSIVLDSTVAVYPTPEASFSWSPTYPSVLNPTVQFYNGTDPRTEATKYFWEIQYNRNNIVSVHTLTDENPSYDFSTYNNPGEVSGDYSVRLITRSDNLAPSGNIVYCRDTAESTILVINDFLQFPNVVTPNGDGINDRFVILNLVGGMGYLINSLDIYNKWGARVYHKENIAKETDFWDPADMPAGSYFYRFTAKGYNGSIEHSGVVEVVK
ncbi:MAG: gliding motility-associated C-terminal domain-containing protein [Bacteroidales bacterium]|nr:gliding motility-associated C-terminal domain-containing protein [Bacteroidales bacterium]